MPKYEPTQLRKSNESPLNVDTRLVERGLNTAREGDHAIIAHMRSREAEREAANDLRNQRTANESSALSRAHHELASRKATLNEPGHTKRTKAEAEADVANQEKHIERLKAQIASAKAADAKAKKQLATEEWMDFRRVLKVFEGYGKRPHKPEEIELPKEYRGEELAALQLVREQISALHDREQICLTCPYPEEVSLANMRAAILRKAETTNRIALGAACRPQQLRDGQISRRTFTIGDDAWVEATLPLVLMHFENRIKEMYAKRRASEFDSFETMTLAERTAEQKRLLVECNRLERIEGEILRRAYLKGHTPILRPDSNPKSYFPYIIDPDAEWEEPRSAILGAGTLQTKVN